MRTSRVVAALMVSAAMAVTGVATRAVASPLHNVREIVPFGCNHPLNTTAASCFGLT